MEQAVTCWNRFLSSSMVWKLLFMYHLSNNIFDFSFANIRLANAFHNCFYQNFKVPKLSFL